MKKITANELEKIRGNKRVRQRLAYESPFWFTLLYLRHHLSAPLASFHMEMFHLIQEEKYNFVVVMAFRESGKSTIMNMANVLWSILGKPGKKFVIIVSNTQEQAKNHFLNIKSELEGNEALREDFGPFTENEAAWNRLSLELDYCGAKILSIARDQRVRGLKHNQYRPDLIICDDLEDSVSVEDRTLAAALGQWFESEILPLGNADTKVIVLGNLLSHYWGDPTMNRDSFILRLRLEILTGKIQGIFRAYPLIDDRGKNLWESRYPNRKAVLALRTRVSLGIWIREYLLKSYGQNNEEGPNIKFLTEDSMRDLLERIENNRLKDGYKRVSPYQKALVSQMKEFAIDAPRHSMPIFESLDDPKYFKFLDDMYFYPKKEYLEKRIAKDKKRYGE
jgi:hypothetical protein